MVEDKNKKLKKKSKSKEKVKPKNSNKDKDFFIGKLRLGTAAVVKQKINKLEDVVKKEFLKDIFGKKNKDKHEESEDLLAEEVYVPGVRDSYIEEKKEDDASFGEKFGSNVYGEKNKDVYSEIDPKSKDPYESIVDIRNLKERKKNS